MRNLLQLIGRGYAVVLLSHSFFDGCCFLQKEDDARRKALREQVLSQLYCDHARVNCL